MNPILIEIKQDRPGFDHFIGAWVCKGDINIIIDVGPANSVTRLIESLIAMDLDRVDFILLTHIHIDHAGGLADFLDHFPMAKVICHSKGIRHLVEPSKLWTGSRTALGEIADFYGPIKPVQREMLIPHTDADIDGLEIIETPGHAPHHLSFIYQGNLFVGEAGGNYFIVHEKEYLRPATPPIFSLGESLKGIDLLLAAEDHPICYSHFGKAKSSHRLLHRFRNQLIQWNEIIKEAMCTGQRHIVERSIERLLEKDPNINAFEAMEPEIRDRERFFLTNSVRGYVGFLQEQ